MSEAAPILVRIGESFLKGKNRGHFIRRLTKNTRKAVADIEGVTVEAQHLRLIVWHPPAASRKVIARLQRVFGIQSLSPTTLADPDLDAAAQAAIAVAKTWPEGTRFKVETKRRNKQFPMRSPAISAEVGKRIIDACGFAVDVHHPDRTVCVDLTAESCFVYCDWLPGAGGLPVGSAASLMLLLSGGIDSPVAGWSAMRRGSNLSAAYFHSFPYTGDKTKEKVISLAKNIARWQGRMALHVIHFTEVQKELRTHRRDDLAILLYRRMMMRVASALAEREGAKGLVTGESLGQVASQTIENIGVIGDAATLPVFRPLITFDKEEIIDRARSIGSYDLSILPYEDSCQLFVPKNPATRARVRDLVNAERDFDIASMTQALCDTAERMVIE